MISVLMATFQGAAYVEAAIASVLDQRGVELELLITDDGSTDATATILRRWAEREPRINLAVGPHAGMASARNASRARARGRYIALLDQDDLWPAGKLARQQAVLDATPEIAAVFGLTRMIGDATVSAEPGYTMLLSAGLLRGDAVDAVGAFNADCGTADDLDFLCRLLEAGHRVALDPELGVLHRRHPAQATADRVRTRRDCVRALAHSLQRRRRNGGSGPIDHPLLKVLR